MSQIDLMEEAVPAKAENRKRKDLVALAEILGTVDLPVSHTAARLADDFPVPNRRKPVRAVPSPQVLRVHQETELAIRIDNDPGTLGRVLDFVQAEGFHVVAYSSYADWDGAVLLLVVREAWRVKAALEAQGLTCKTNSIVVVDAADRVGTVARCGILLGNAGIEILYSYASVSAMNRCYAVFKTTDEERALRVLDASALAHAA